jgi:Fe-S-cluster-containing hydrogenase component 2
MEVDNFPGRIWVVAHKPVAVAAGMGVMGIHRNVIHPKFGNFILLATILLDAPISRYSEPLDYSPCLECKLCVAACPVGAIGKDGSFDFVACSVHNYREFMGGFTDWAQTIADSADAADFRSRVSDSENASMWQSLSFKANYKAAYCLAVCPAGEDVIEPYLDDRKAFMDLVLKPLQDKRETLYVLPNSRALAHAERRYPHKTVKIVDSGIRGR